MKILFISSGYSGIYPYFEHAIEAAFSAFNHPCLKINPEYNHETIEQIHRFQPDFVLAFVGYKIPPSFLQFLKQQGYALGIWFTEDPYYMDESIRLAGDFHFIFTIDLGAYHYYKEAFPTKNIDHLPLGTDPNLYFPPIIDRIKIYDLCLIGYPYPERIQLVQNILNNTPYTLILAGPLWRKYIGGNHRKRLTLINKWVEPDFVRQLFHSAKIILNPHRSFDFSKNKNTLGIESMSINNRTFDIAACGGFQLLMAKPDLETHFSSASEMVSYATNDDCLKLIHQFEKDEQARVSYSEKARERVLHHHTFFHRVQQIFKQLASTKEGG